MIPETLVLSSYYYGMNKDYENVNKNFVALKLDKCNWHDFVELFGERGACGGCWCMSWRLKKSDFERQKGLKNKQAMYELVKNEEIIDKNIIAKLVIDGFLFHLKI